VHQLVYITQLLCFVFLLPDFSQMADKFLSVDNSALVEALGAEV